MTEPRDTFMVRPRTTLMGTLIGLIPAHPQPQWSLGVAEARRLAARLVEACDLAERQDEGCV